MIYITTRLTQLQFEVMLKMTDSQTATDLFLNGVALATKSFSCWLSDMTISDESSNSVLPIREWLETDAINDALKHAASQQAVACGFMRGPAAVSDAAQFLAGLYCATDCLIAAAAPVVEMRKIGEIGPPTPMSPEVFLTSMFSPSQINDLVIQQKEHKAWPTPTHQPAL